MTTPERSGEITGATLSPTELEAQVVRGYLDELATRVVSPPTGRQIVEVTIIRHTPTEDGSIPERPDHELHLRQYLGANGKPITELSATSVRNNGDILTLQGGILGENFPNPSLTLTSDGNTTSGIHAINPIEKAIKTGEIETIPTRRTIAIPRLEELVRQPLASSDDLDEVLSPS